jgi:hypothetical protein
VGRSNQSFHIQLVDDANIYDQISDHEDTYQEISHNEPSNQQADHDDILAYRQSTLQSWQQDETSPQYMSTDSLDSQHTPIRLPLKLSGNSAKSTIAFVQYFMLRIAETNIYTLVLFVARQSKQFVVKM